jgi:nucleoside-diphosphate-sugar epimerase
MRKRLLRLLLVGPGDIALRALPRLAAGYQVLALARTAERAAQLAHLGVEARVADLDSPASLDAALEPADCVLHCAPPATAGTIDARTRNLLAALTAKNGKFVARKTPGMVTRRVVYVSTSGVYGDCEGALVDESRPLNPATDRARRRCDAEAALAQWCADHQAALITLRAPGIYAADRLPLERLRRGTPVLRREDDVYTNHIHADDLAGICVRALDDDAPAGACNACDDAPMLMGDWMDLVADQYGLPRPPRIARRYAAANIPAPSLSFMGESRRLDNTRLKRELGYRLRHASVREGLRAARALQAAG